jgi:hypothetical protein
MPFVTAKIWLAGITHFPADNSFQPQECRVHGDPFILHVFETTGVVGSGLLSAAGSFFGGKSAAKSQADANAQNLALQRETNAQNRAMYDESRGSTGSATVTLTATDGSQILTAGGFTGDGSILLTAGSGAGVAIHSTGAGPQALQAAGNITLTGGGTSGGTEAASVLVRQSGDGGQSLEARGSIVLTGGIGGDGTVLVHNSGSGTQRIGDPFRCCTLYATDTVTLQGGSGAGSSVELRSTGGQQLVEPFAVLNVYGGTGSGAHARIASTSASNQVIGGPSYFCCNIDPVDTIAIAAGSGTNAFAEITATGGQRVTSASSLAMTGSAATGGQGRVPARRSHSFLLPPARP